MDYVKLSKLIEKMKIENLTPDIDVKKILIKEYDVNRPALQLTGFFEYFDNHRIQIIGHVEHTYMQQNEDKGVSMIKKILEYQVPCLIYCRDLEISDEVVELGNTYGVPILRSKETTSAFMAEVIRWLRVELAPRISVHGVLVDIYGEGVLIMGESGIGKSEVAIELIHRGHRLVSDDVVEIMKVSDETLIGTAPDITRHFIELRGIGIIDAKTLFGVEGVKNTQSIDLVIQLEEWNKDTDYDRMGLEDKYTEFLGNKVVCHSIPIRPGRNVAIICECAAVNYRQKKMGYNAAREMYNRVTENMMMNTRKDD
ncbi:MAG: HPr(Ser) kinase/phosphatase [Lachnospiraceae bacterium]|jgi:HPr serine kinase N terminus|nr:HPr(Ser) kinase/phosphatase [Lachnoclostridium sp.]MDD7521708.1 HPr(Ser) kinase/phosphatase [Lachnoclostridium sp.]MDY2599853.1 HPr(Ser) kinase/phosphatase [Lachnospiraceae bacterium]